MKKISFLFTILIFIFISLIAQKVHVVKKGDTLWDIAGFYYNNPFLWRNIYNANLDKIEDPHWIYPGQEFIIPDIPEDATTMESTEEPSSIGAEERQAADLIIEKESDNKQITYQKSNVEKSGAQIKAIREDIQKVERTKSMRISNSVQYAVAKKMAFQSGFIAMENPAIGKIDKLYKGSHSYTTHEKVYVKLNSPDVNQDIVGKKLIIFKWDNKVKNSDGENLGKYVKILGTITIDKIENDLAYGTITGTYGIIDKGDYIGLYKAPIIPLNSAYLKESNDIRAFMIDTAEPKMRVNEFSIVLIDIGKESNINSGDVFTIIRKNKTGNYYAAGALQVLVPYDGYSTAAVISIKDNTDISPYEELKLSYRNKNAYILEQYRKINTIQSESGEIEETTEEEPIMETEETTAEETVEEPIIETETAIEETIEEPVIETEETTVEETTTEEPVMEETGTAEVIETPVMETEETTVEDTTEEPAITDTTQTEEEVINETDEGFTIEETENDTTNNDTLVIEGEDEIIIIEEE